MIYTYPKVINVDDIKEININNKIWEQDYTLEKFEDGTEGFIYCIKIQKVEQFKYFCKKMFELERLKPTLYRGQSNFNWKLNSTLEREIIGNIPKEKIKENVYTEISKQHLENFKKLARGKLVDQTLLKENTTLEENNELWSIAQHLKLKTPLIDWSKSLGVGLFFAFDSQEECEYRVVYRMLRDFIRLSPNSVMEPRMDYYGRLTAQRGVFTYWGLDYHLMVADNILQKYIEENTDRLQTPPDLAKKKVMTKYYISSSLEKEVKAYLEHIGITYETIYPDLQGVIQKTNLDLNILFEKYKN